jgi:hypothetical protein
MVPSSPQLARNGRNALQISMGGPPPSSVIRFRAPAAPKNPTTRPSGERNGTAVLRVGDGFRLGVPEVPNVELRPIPVPAGEHEAATIRRQGQLRATGPVARKAAQAVGRAQVEEQVTNLTVRRR